MDNSKRLEISDAGLGRCIEADFTRHLRFLANRKEYKSEEEKTGVLIYFTALNLASDERSQVVASDSEMVEFINREIQTIRSIIRRCIRQKEG